MSRLPCPRSQLPCTRSHLPCPSFYLPEYTSHSDWLHHNNLIYIVILNYIYCPVNNKIGLANKGMHPLMEWVHAAYMATPLTASRPATEGWWAVSRHHLKYRPGTEGWRAVSRHHLKYRPGTEGWWAVSRHHLKYRPGTEGWRAVSRHHLKYRPGPRKLCAMHVISAS